VVFGSQDSGVSNPAGPDGRTFLDTVWAQAPFQDHGSFLETVDRTAREWEGSGLFSASEHQAVVQAARNAEEELQT
jgi:hypothetical protein